MENVRIKSKRVPMLGISSAMAFLAGGMGILWSDYFVFFALIFIPAILLGGIIVALIAVIRRETY